MGNILTRTRMVLRRKEGMIESPKSSAQQLFTYDAEEGEDVRGNVHWLDGDVWDDMGRPEVITVTIEPGDLLNEEEA